MRIDIDGDTLVVDSCGMATEPHPSRAVAELLALAATGVDPTAAREMLGLQITVTHHTTELELDVAATLRPLGLTA